jgi:hypothetical protein
MNKLITTILLSLLMGIGQSLFAQQQENLYEENILIIEVDLEFAATVEQATALMNQLAFRTLKEKSSVTLVAKVFNSNNPKLQPYWLLEFENGSIDQLIFDLRQFPWIRNAEKVPQHQLFFTPSDLASKQWGLKKINAEAAWDQVRGSRTIRIAVVDDAVYIDHVYNVSKS